MQELKSVYTQKEIDEIVTSGTLCDVYSGHTHAVSAIIQDYLNEFVGSYTRVVGYQMYVYYDRNDRICAIQYLNEEDDLHHALHLDMG